MSGTSTLPTARESFRTELNQLRVPRPPHLVLNISLTQQTSCRYVNGTRLVSGVPRVLCFGDVLSFGAPSFVAGSSQLHNPCCFRLQAENSTVPHPAPAMTNQSGLVFDLTAVRGSGSQAIRENCKLLSQPLPDSARSVATSCW